MALGTDPGAVTSRMDTGPLSPQSRFPSCTGEVGGPQESRLCPQAAASHSSRPLPLPPSTPPHSFPASKQGSTSTPPPGARPQQGHETEKQLLASTEREKNHKNQGAFVYESLQLRLQVGREAGCSLVLIPRHLLAPAPLPPGTRPLPQALQAGCRLGVLLGEKEVGHAKRASLLFPAHRTGRRAGRGARTPGWKGSGVAHTVVTDSRGL